jgi:hypothetical protein
MKKVIGIISLIIVTVAIVFVGTGYDILKALTALVLVSLVVIWFILIGWLLF